VKLGLLLLEPKLGLLGPVLELLTPLPHLLRLGIATTGHVSEHVSELLGPLPHRLLGLAIGLEGLDLIHGFVIHRFVRLLIDRFVEISIESLEILFRGDSAFLRGNGSADGCASASISASSWTGRSRPSGALV
jgi:hypothetical protein